MKPSPSLLHTLDLTEEELSNLFALIESAPLQKTAKRKYSRSPYVINEGIVVEVIDRGRPKECARVAPRNVSAGGIGFLHHGRLAAGTTVAVQFPAGQGRIIAVTGTVVRCFCLTKEVHDVGVEFDHPAAIEPILANAGNFASAG